MMEKQQDIPDQARAEYIEVESNVRLHISDAGAGRPFNTIQVPYRANSQAIADPTTGACNNCHFSLKLL
jgi:hypothetical protein